ncbi:MAG TPA: hypothetical protein VEK76_11635 [Candidatus Binatia bacterium]|nr:hypothetical protein [Candidatus Binatia bacterium]
MTARRPEQVAADKAEDEAIERYLCHRKFAGLLDEAVARADAMWRLEEALRQVAPQR